MAVVYGIHAVQSLLESQPDSISSLLVENKRHDGRMQKLLSIAEQHHVQVDLVNAAVLKQKAGDVAHQGVVAMVQDTLPEVDWQTLWERHQEKTFFLILDGVQDPHNLGACLRTADAVGVHAVIVPKDHACGLTPVVRKVASGAAEHVPLITVTNLARTLEEMKSEGIWIIGTAGEATHTIYEQDFKGPIAIACGAEGTGLRRLTKEKCDFLVSIPMQGKVSSLNVSVAAAVVMYEAMRGRLV